jgi:hypothetical protein
LFCFVDMSCSERALNARSVFSSYCQLAAFSKLTMHKKGEFIA